MGIHPEGEDLRKAVKWVSGERKYHPETPVQKLVKQHLQEVIEVCRAITMLLQVHNECGDNAFQHAAAVVDARERILSALISTLATWEADGDEPDKPARCRPTELANNRVGAEAEKGITVGLRVFPLGSIDGKDPDILPIMRPDAWRPRPSIAPFTLDIIGC